MNLQLKRLELPEAAPTNVRDDVVGLDFLELLVPGLASLLQQTDVLGMHDSAQHNLHFLLLLLVPENKVGDSYRGEKHW